jgi:DNA-binding transcriptional ArsR family regulator
MDVGSLSGRDGDSLVTQIADAIARPAVRGRAGNVFIAGPPGFGKTSLLAAATALVGRRLGVAVAWVSGGVVASDGHFTRLLASTAEGTDIDGQTQPSGVLAIDDIDVLVFKRERIAERIARLLASDSIRVLATCHPAAADRFSTTGHPFADAIYQTGDRVHVMTIDALDDESARALIRRRAPRLSDTAAQAIIAAAGGHPAALVFLSRLADLRTSDTGNHTGAVARDGYVNSLAEGEAQGIGALIDWAAEFAGAVYAESWAGLGPQQRAILWQLGKAGAPATASDIAEAIDLPASHVSAQITRLGADGLVRRTTVRGQFTLAPLLARWIARRAARGQRATRRHTSRRRGTRASRSKH